MRLKDYYKILGFETNNVTLNDIRNAFREKAKMYHPDLNDGSNNAEEKFKDINEAYRILSDKASRKKYDKIWNSSVGRKKNKAKNAQNIKDSKNVFEEIKNMIFGAKKDEMPKEKKDKGKPKIKGENIETSINISIEEAFFGGTKKISLRTIERTDENFCSKNPSWN